MIVPTKLNEQKENWITYELAAEMLNIKVTQLGFWLARTNFPHDSEKHLVHPNILAQKL